MLAQAAAAGGAVGLLLVPAFDVPDTLPAALRWLLLGGVAALAFLIATELTSAGTMHVELAQRAMTSGPYRGRFWASVVVGLAAAAVLAVGSIAADSPALGIAAGVAAIVGIALYEDAFVRAGQSVPLS